MIKSNMLKDKTALIIGCGGLGGYVIEQLARYGVGNLVLMDGDAFNQSNLNRQLMSTKSNLGSSKVAICKERIEQISDAKVIAISQMLDEKNANIIDKVDIVIDCVDNIKSRLILAKECDKRDKILVHGAVEGQEGQVMLCYPKINNLKKLFTNNQEIKHFTNSYSVATIASLQCNLAIKALLGEGEKFNNQLFIVNLEDLIIKKLEIL